MKNGIKEILIPQTEIFYLKKIRKNTESDGNKNVY